MADSFEDRLKALLAANEAAVEWESRQHAAQQREDYMIVQRRSAVTSTAT